MDAATKGKSSQIGRARQFLTEITDNDGKSTKLYKCNLCKKELSGVCASNLVTHFKATHKQLYNDRIGDFTKDTIAVQRMKLIYSCVELVAINSYPFSLLSSSGFRNAIEHQTRALQLDGHSVNISDPHLFEIKDKVREVANKMKELITEEVKGKLISVMTDTATRNGRAIFGVNIQYKLDGKLKLVSLGMRELKQSHTAEHLSDIMREILAEYQIDLLQALSITTDNGSNMLAMVKDLENKLFQNHEDGDERNNQDENNNRPHHRSAQFQRRNSEEVENPEDIDNEIAELVTDAVFTDDDVLDIILDESVIYEQLLEKLVDDLRKRSGNHHIFMQSIRCAAHTLQLAIKDALLLLGTNDLNVISLCRIVAKFMRYQSTRDEMRRVNLVSKVPALDVKTRWNSTYIMIRDVLQCETAIEYFAQSERQCQLLLNKWGQLNELKRILHVLYLTTVVLQNNDFTLSDFYGCLKLIDLKLNQIIEEPRRKLTGLARKLQQSMKKRMTKVIENPLMVCALFLDPRYKFSIDSDPEKVSLAKLHIGHIWERIKMVKFGGVEQEPETPELNVTPENMDKYFAELDMHLNESTGIRASSTGASSCDRNVIVDAINKYEVSVMGARMKSSESVHLFWESKKEEFGSELYEIASVLFAVPPTQASVERNFSALKYMFTDYRYNLNQDLLEALLLIHLNRDYFGIVKNNEIEKTMYSLLKC